jgi:hypothetical protein
LWIAVGTAVIAHFAYLLIVTVSEENTWDPGKMTVHALASLVGGLFQAGIGGFFLYEGIAVCRGAVPSTAGVAAGSLLFAGVFVGMALYLPQEDQSFRMVLPWIVAAVLLAAGALVLINRRQYEAWWKAKSRQASRVRWPE